MLADGLRESEHTTRARLVDGRAHAAACEVEQLDRSRPEAVDESGRTMRAEGIVLEVQVRERRALLGDNADGLSREPNAP